MKTILTFIFFVLFNIVYGQELMTIGEVFDFKVGDEFQFTGTADNQPPNADRIKITGKYLSENQDTVFYIRFHDSYYTEVVYDGDPHLEYHFYQKTDTVFYANLDSSIALYDAGFNIDQYVKYSAKLCDSLINGCSYMTGPGYENDSHIHEYGKGLGETRIYYFSYQAGATIINTSLFYYKKVNGECGSPDTLYLGTNETFSVNPYVKIYPNPVNHSFKIINNTAEPIIQFKILSLTGKTILSGNIENTRNEINVNDLKTGIYFVYLKTKNNFIIKKIVKK